MRTVNEVQGITDLNKGISARHIKMWSRYSWLSMGLYAWAFVITGAVLVEIAASFQLTTAQAGLLVSLPAFGFTAASLAAGYFANRSGLQSMLAVSLMLLSGSLAVAAVAPAAVILGLAAVGIGFSGGLLETAGNGLIAELHQGSAARELNRLHVFFGVGAFISPIVAAAFIRWGTSWREPFGFAMILTLLLAVALWLAPKGVYKQDSTITISRLLKLVRLPKVAIAWVGMFLFVSAELGFSNWIVTYLRKEASFPLELASLGLSIFWLAMLLGRYLNTFIPHHWNDRWVITTQAFTGAISQILALLTQSPVLVFLGLVLCGLSMAGLVPWMLAFVTEPYQDPKGSITGLIFTGTGQGMLLGPGLVGVAAGRAGLSAAMYLCVGMLLCLGLLFLLSKQGRRL